MSSVFWSFVSFTLLSRVCLSFFPSSLLKHGVNIHFRSPMDGEMGQLSSAYTISRMDFTWASIETQEGIYDFSAYDTLLSSLKEYNVQAYWILDYGNPLYNNGNAPNTQESIDAFVNWVQASMLHFYGNNIIWELWNEPDLSYAWKPQPNPSDYANLALAVGQMLKQNSSAPYYNELFIGPATAGVDMDFLNTVFSLGVLKYFDAVSVHPYRDGGPESAISDYQNLRTSIDHYNPNASNYIPIISGEWGWSTCYSGNEVIKCNGGAAPAKNTYLDQANYLVRQYLINNIAKVPVSIFYDWKDDGNDSTQGEDNFGTVNYAYINSSIPYIPKLSFNAAYTYHKLVGSNDYNLNDFKIINSSCVDNNNCNNDYVWSVQISNNNVITWYAPNNNNSVSVDIIIDINYNSNGCFNVFDMFGDKMNELCSNNNGNNIQINNVTQSVLYLLNYT